MGAGCAENTPYQDYIACADTNCPSSICGAPIIFATTYGNGAQDVNFDSVGCASDNCCTQMDACADPSMDGYLDMNDPESSACLACLIDPNDSACPGGAVAAAASDFNSCFMTNCGGN